MLFSSLNFLVKARKVFLSLMFCLFLNFSLQALNYSVTTTNDSGSGSLRDAINTVNSSLDLTNEITFNIPGQGPFRIQLLSPLPIIFNQVTIDGYTQPGATPNTLAQGTDAQLLIEINGNNYTLLDNFGEGFGLLIVADGSIIRGLVVNEWLTAGIFVVANDAVITGNFIGINVSGTTVAACAYGILIEGQFNQIGTSNYADRNLIAGSFGFFTLGGSITSFGSTQTTIQGNLIGTDRTGTTALENSCYGIVSGGDIGTVIGGLNPNEGNLISGQSVYGILIEGSTDFIIQGNLIGTDISGTHALGNLNAGLALFAGASSDLISNNLISGNGNGVFIGRPFNANGPNTLQSNLIGTDITGTKKLGNTRNGIYICTNSNNIGGSLDAQKNIISGNGENGILIAEGASDNVVIGNFIGTDISGHHHLGNKENGIQIGLTGNSGAALSNTIGGLQTGEGNIIAANKDNGILILAQSQNNMIQGNLIGLGKDKKKLPNYGDGVKIISSSLNTMGGGNSPEFGNIIAYNYGSGITIGKNISDLESVNNLIFNNSIYKNEKQGINLHGRNGQAGPNHLQRPPKINCAVANSGILQVKGELKGATFGSYYVIQFFSSPLENDPQGKTLLGNYLISPDASGRASFSFTTNQPESKAYITATSSQVDSSGNPRETSEFSYPQKMDLHY